MAECLLPTGCIFSAPSEIDDATAILWRRHLELRDAELLPKVNTANAEERGCPYQQALVGRKSCGETEYYLEWGYFTHIT